ncbi:MAG: hypothetical protein IID14_03755 [Candidatus Marinimicrobia bacterium]|nr:hypothetical protein [Candidatus Neomarinimicrobiota bacterium]
MTYYTILTFLHILFVVLFVGSGAGLAILWKLSRTVDTTQRLPLVEGIAAISQKVTVMAGSFLLLVGILMLISRPALLSAGALWYVKIILGLMLVGLSHAAHGKIKKIRAALDENEVDTGSEKFWDMITKVMPVLAIVTLFLGFWLTHG